MLVRRSLQLYIMVLLSSLLSVDSRILLDPTLLHTLRVLLVIAIINVLLKSEINFAIQSITIIVSSRILFRSDSWIIWSLLLLPLQIFLWGWSTFLICSESHFVWVSCGLFFGFILSILLGRIILDDSWWRFLKNGWFIFRLFFFTHFTLTFAILLITFLFTSLILSLLIFLDFFIFVISIRFL